MSKCALVLVEDLKSFHITPDYCLEKEISYRSGLRCRKELERYESAAYIAQNPRNCYILNCQVNDGATPNVLSLRLHCLTTKGVDKNSIKSAGGTLVNDTVIKTECDDELNCLEVENSSNFNSFDPNSQILNENLKNNVKKEIGIDVKPDLASFAKHKVTGRVYCDYCNYSTKFRSFMKKHVAKHSGDPRCKLFCPLCPFVTFSRTQHNEHLCTTHVEEDGRFGCTLCVYRTVYKSNLYRHLLRHKKWNIDVTCEEKTNIPNSIVGGFYLKSCPYCDFTTNDNRLLKTHMNTHMEKMTLHCEYCNYSTHFKNNLKFHMKDKHSEVAEADL